MSWSDLHRKSEQLASEAQMAMAQSDGRAPELYAEAAKFEAGALAELAPTKLRTIGITAVSAVALWFKARQYAQAQKLAYQVLGNDGLPPFAVEQLQGLLQSVWSEQVRQSASVKFSEGELLISVSGGQSVTGGAPLDLVLAKVENIKSLFFRTVEFLERLPHRKHGAAPIEVQNVCRPWLFQTVPGSYQFAVAIEDVAQRTLFGPGIPSVEEIKKTFVSIVRESAQDPETALAQRVPDEDYQGTFLKLTRSLAPTGTDFAVMAIRQSSADSDPVILTEDSRRDISAVIRQKFTKPRQSGETPSEIRGVLRAVHLDEDWLEVTVDGQHKRVYEVGEAVDDLLGPLVNREVIVQTVTKSGQRVLFRDIEAAP
jgi:hypothetical protein